MSGQAVEWRDVVGYEGLYEVSNTGLVRRADGTPKKAHLSKGYPAVSLAISGFRKNRTVHQLVAEAFIGPRAHGISVNHKNCVKSDNRVENLEYVTHLENMRHAAANGLLPGNRSKWSANQRANSKGRKLAPMHGEANRNAKLTEADVRLIRLLACEHSYSELGRRFGVSNVSIRDAVKRKTWTHVE